jgi:thymidine phosphorylase
VIEAKRWGGSVHAHDLERLIGGYVSGRVGDGPMAAFLMACAIEGLDGTEVAAMTRIFVSSGTTLALDRIDRPVVDKHSTGGVSDGVSLIFAPLVAALGLVCVKLAGRGLGHTGGTVDKLESIPGMRLDLPPEDLAAQARTIGCVIAAQSDELVPADRAIYVARRDRDGALGAADRGERDVEEARGLVRSRPARREGRFGRVHARCRRRRVARTDLPGDRPRA